MKEEKRISPAIVLVPIAAALGLGVVAALAFAAPPPTEYACPYCPEAFATYEELVAHVQTVHPGERIPLPIEWE